MVGLAVSACSTLGFEDYCRYSDNHSFREADPGSLRLLLEMSSEKPNLCRSPLALTWLS